MPTNSAKTERLQLIFKFFREFVGVQATMANLVKFVNGNARFGRAVNQRTIESDIREIRRSYDVNIQVKRQGVVRYYCIENEVFLPLIVDQEKDDFAILFQLLHNYREMRSVQWLQSLLQQEFGVDKKYFREDMYFVDAMPFIANEETMIQLAVNIVKYAKQGEAIQFSYDSVGTNASAKLKVVAPLQVRRYDGRYYLLAMEILDTVRMEFAQYPHLFVLDRIEEGRVYPAISEEGDGSNESGDDTITFDYKKLARDIDLPHYFQHCLGVVRPDDDQPKLIQLTFTDWARSYVKNQPIHASQNIRSDGQQLVITIFVYDTFEVDFILGKFGRFCERK
jgi:hypothetical protein